MNIILDNVIFSRQKVGGITTWWKSITSTFTNDRELSFICSDGLFWFLPKMKKCDIFLSSYITINIYPRCKNYFVIHDVIREKYDSSIKTNFYKIYIKIAIKISYKIITISEKVKDEIHSIYKVPKSKIIVIKHGIKFSKGNLQKRTIHPSNEYLIVGKRKSYKNFKGSIHKLQNQNVVIAGPPLNSDEEYLLKKNNITWKEYQYPSDQILGELYSSSKYLFWPSLDEGFGLPLLEAINFGCIPIVHSNEINKEILGDFILLIDDIPNVIVKYSLEEYWEYFSQNYSLDRMKSEFRKAIIQEEK